MSERKITGGEKEFHYSKEDLDRIRKTDTDATRAFKVSYAQWQEKRAEEKLLDEELRKQRRNLTFIFLFLLVAVAILLWMQFFG